MRVLKIAVGILLVPVALFLILAMLFYFPPFQRWITGQVVSYASEKTGMEISVGRVDLSFPLDLLVSDVKVIAPNDSLPQQKDTIADIGKTVVDVRFLPLLSGNVEVGELDIRSAKINTVDFISDTHVKGSVDALRLVADIDLGAQNVVLDRVSLDGADVDVQLSDTAKTDTSKTENRWKIRLNTLQVKRTKVAVSMPGDTLAVGVDIASATARNGNFDLFEGLYQLGAVDLAFGDITYDNRFEPFAKGVDYNHIALSDVAVRLDTLSYRAPDLYLKIHSAKMKEKSGLQLNGLSGVVKMDSMSLHIPALSASTPYSNLHTSLSMDMNAFDNTNPGQFSLKAEAQIGKNDIMTFASALPERLKASWPHYPLSVEMDVNGNAKRMDVNSLKAELPTAFNATASGYVLNVLETDDLLANLDIDVSTYNLGFVTSSFLDPATAKTVRIPSGIKMKGAVGADGSSYKANLRLAHGGGWMSLNGVCNVDNMTYNAAVVANNMPLRKFLPGMNVTPLSARVKVKGSGTDILSKSTHLSADAEISKFGYENIDLSGTTATLDIRNGVVHSAINSANRLLRGNISLDALLGRKDLKATLACELVNADFYGMGLSEAPLAASLCAHMDVAGDMEDYYKVNGFVSDVTVRDSSSVFRTEELNMDALTDRDTTWVKVASGDFGLDMATSGGYRDIISLADKLADELNRQIARKYISQDSLRQVLPVGHIVLHSGKDNFVYDYARRMGFPFRGIDANISSSPVSGLNGYVQIDSLVASGMQLDKSRLELVTDSLGFRYHCQVKNEKDNPQYCFNALLDGSIIEAGSNINLVLRDDKDKVGIQTGLKASFEPNGIRIGFTEDDMILGYRDFKASKGSYVLVGDDSRVSASMELKASDGTGIQLFSNDENLDALQDLTLGVHHLDLSSITGIIPYFPHLQGIMNGDFHVIQTPAELSVSTSLGIDDLYYEGCPMGDLSTEFVYIPLEDDGHYVDGILTHNGNDIGTVKGTYKTVAGEETLDADIDLEKLPLNLVNGFMPDQLIGLEGYGDGTLKIRGPLTAMKIDGEVDLDSAYIESVPYGVELRFDDRAVYIKDSKLLLDNFNMYANNSQPLVMNGNIDFSDMDNVAMNVRMNARNFLLVDSKENRRSEVFGKTYVNFNANMTGPVAALRINGKLDVLGSTDMTYIMRDTPLTTDNRLGELVKFTDFNGKEEASVARPPIEGLYMDLAVSVNDGARVFCALNATKSNYLDMMGGGDLRMIYSQDELRLTGRYTVNSGEMKYSLPVIPLKTFTIQNGSYVEFTGDVMNPKLNITATETTKTGVNADGTTRSVVFNCGVVITQTLNDMGLEFIVNAPEDMTVNNELQTMSKEERGKIAVTMLTTGMYLSDNNLSAFSMNDALSSFLQNEINNISSAALRTLDLSIGLDNSTDATGTLHTDYTFKFAKRFWGNRIRVVVGGKVSSTQTSAENIFDNVALEYRLDKNANTNLRLFYDRATYDFLEGYVGQYGVGVVWKRRLQSLSELFRRKTSARPASSDSIVAGSDTKDGKK